MVSTDEFARVAFIFMCWAGDMICMCKAFGIIFIFFVLGKMPLYCILKGIVDTDACFFICKIMSIMCFHY